MTVNGSRTQGLPVLAVPPHAALEQEPAEGNIGTVAAREPAGLPILSIDLLGQKVVQLAAGGARRGRGDLGGRIVAELTAPLALLLVKVNQVDQHRTMPHAPRRPAVSTAAHADASVVFFCEFDTGYD